MIGAGRRREAGRQVALMHRMTLAWQLARHLGPMWLARRAWYVFSRRAGWLARRDPVHGWDDLPLADLVGDSRLADADAIFEHRRREPPAFFFRPADFEAFRPLWARFDSSDPTVIRDAGAICLGEFRCFGRRVKVEDGCPDWHTNAENGRRAPNNVHWSLISDFALGDIKFLWEPSRFAFTYPLVRAYARTGDETYAEAFWRLVESWRAANPPYLGANWKCEQESALRLMAWCFGLYRFADSPATTPTRVAALIQMVGATGRRIAGHLAYPVSQDNNHGMTAAAGLWTAGLLFPELREAACWKRTGRQLLERLARRLIYDDGAFSQHSTNYQRVVLHAYAWSIRLGQLHDEAIATDVVDRIVTSAQLLYQLQDATTGHVPCYGHHDGALILPLSNCSDADYRPAVQAVHYLATGERCYEPGPWDEDLLWLYGPRAVSAPAAPPQRGDLSAESGGYYTLRTAESFAFTRCAGFHHRPSQADLLHVDVWWRGQNIAVDAGSYRYNAPPPWDNALGSTAVHNTVSVEGRDQMRHASRFLWLPWPTGKVLRRGHSQHGRLACWEGTHDGFARQGLGAVHGRMIWRLGDDYFVVLDRIATSANRACRLHWLLGDFPYRGRPETGLFLDTPRGQYVVQLGSNRSQGCISLVRGDEHSTRGWQSPTYGQKRPALSLALDFVAPGGFTWSLFGPAPAQGRLEADELVIETTGGRARLAINTPDPFNDPFPICRRAELRHSDQTLLDTWSADA